MNLFDKASLILTPNADKTSKLYSLKPTDGTGDFTFSRTGNATRVNSSGLIEAPRTNLITYSEDFGNVAWSKTNSSVSSNTTISPDGNSTADSLIEDTTNGLHFITQGITVVTNTTYTATIYIKSNTRTKGRFRLNDTGGQPATDGNFDLVAQTISTGTITSVGNGWFRLTMSRLMGSTSGSFVVFLADTSGSISYTGNGTSGLYIWGAQLESGSTATDYIPTTTSARTTFAGITQNGTDASNIPRLNYPSGSGCPSVLLEPSRTNLILQSNSIATQWTAENVTTATGQTTLISGQSTTLITETTVNGVHRVLPTSVTLVNGTTYTYSFFAKPNGGTRNIGFRTGITGTSQNIIFNPNTQSSVSIPAGFTVKITPYTDGYYRYEITVTSATTSDTCSIVMFNGTSISYTGSVSESIYISAVQVEAGSYATSYIPTTTASVTRNPDSFSKTGISSLIGQTEGTIFFDYIAGAAVADDLISFNRVTTNTVVLTQFSSGAIRIVIYYGSSFFQILSSVTVVAGSRYKIALRYKSGDTKIYINGSSAGSSTTAFAFTGSLSEINVNKASAYFAGVQTNQINAAAIYTTGLTDSECAALTT